MRAFSSRPSFSAFPLVPLAGAFAAGVLLARLFEPSPVSCLACGLTFTALAVLAFAGNRFVAASYLTIFALTCTGALLALIEKESVGPNRVQKFYERGEIASGEPSEVSGVLERAPEHAPDGLFVSLRVERWRFKTVERAAAGRVELFAAVRDARAKDAYARLELRRGARIRVMVALTRAENFRNPGVSSFTQYLEQKGVDARGTIKSALLVERLDDERVFVPLVWLDAWRALLTERFDALFTVETAGVLKAAMLGNRHGLSHRTAERFRESGTFHVLVISGLHITFLGGIVWSAARIFTTRRVWRWFWATLFVWSYAIAVGAESSVVRAALMFTFVALAPLLGRPSSTLNALGGAALVLLTWRPGNLLDPSFQLTFLSVAAIVAPAWPLLSKLKEIGEWRPTSATPYPPAGARLWLALAETLFWSERKFRREMMRSTHSYRLFKIPLAARLERLRLQRPLRFVFVALVVSTVVQLSLLPFLVLYFHRLSLVAPLLNVPVGVLMAVLSFAALAATGMSQLADGPAALFVWSAEASNRLLTYSIDPFGIARTASLRLPEYTGAPAIVYGLYYVPLAVFAFLSTRLLRPVGPPHASDARNASATRGILVCAVVAFVVLFVLIVLHPLSAGRPDGRLRIDFLDVGQGDAALLTMPDGRTLLIDGGGRPLFDMRQREDDGPDGEFFERDSRSIGEAVVSEYLWQRGLDRVDFILATHADADHIDGLNDVARNFKVGAAFVGRAPPIEAAYARFAATAKEAGIVVQLIGRGDVVRVGAVNIEVLWPPRVPVGSSSSSRNDDSVVLRVRFGAKTFLLTGDIESGAESALLSTGDDLRCDALKVAHHGSRTSSTEAFVNATRPALAVICVGLDSPYGHPHKEVLERWRAAGAQILTTGESGTVTVSTDGQDLKVETFVRR